MNLKEAIKTYNSLNGNEIIKQFEEARHLIIEEMANRKPELEYYKSSNKYKYYIEKPYEKITFENGKAIKKKRNYSAIAKSKTSTVNFCLSLCNYSREDIIKLIEKHIKEDNEDCL